MNRAPLFLLYLNVLVIATCGLIYELLAGTLASYLLGDSVTQFSLVIGVYLSALGVGAWLSRYVETRIARTFIEVELALALLGGLSAPMLFVAFAWIIWFRVALFGLVFLIGVLVGLELPLLMRILKDHLDFSDLISRVLTFDYIGALLASLLFPILLVPHLGLVRTSLVFGMLNALVGLWGTYLLSPILSQRSLPGLRARAFLVIGILILALFKADSLTTVAEEAVLQSPIIYARQSPFQRIVVTENRGGFQLHLNGHLQFNSLDEYRYHEALVHPALLLAKDAKRVLVLGGGDGLAAREILRYPEVDSVTLVDIDPAMTEMATDLPIIRQLNLGSLQDPRVKVINRDAFLWIGETKQSFDAVVIDFPDPSGYAVGKLYTTRFFRMLHECLSDDAWIGIQCTSPLVAPQSFWCILNTMAASGFDCLPYQVSVPTFGVWGFALARRSETDKHSLDFAVESAAMRFDQQPFTGNRLRFLTTDTLRAMFVMPADIQPTETELNQLNNQVLVRYYDQEWGSGE